MILPWKSDPRKRVLKKGLNRLRRTYQPDLDALRREGKATTDAYDNLFGEYSAMRGPVEEELLTIESYDLRLRALQWAVDVPPVHEWNQGTYGHHHLNESTRARIKVNIRDQKRKSIKWFVQMAALLVGTLVALVGVLNA